MKIEVNGENVSFQTNNGYAQIKRTWQEGDEVSLSFNFEPGLVRSNAKVRYNII